MSGRSELAYLLALVADDLDARLYPRVGVIRQAARLLTQATPNLDEARDTGCRVCGTALPEPATGAGRPRVYCSTRCRDRSRKIPRNRRLSP